MDVKSVKKFIGTKREMVDGGRPGAGREWTRKAK